MDTTMRQLVRDIATDRIGEVMDVYCEGDRPVQIWLRPVGGGAEWTTKPEHVHPVHPVRDGSSASPGAAT